MSILTFDICDFNKKIGTTKFELGKMYVITLNPDDQINFNDGNNRLQHRRCFIINADANGTRLRANDASMFSNPISTNEPVICKFIEQVYTETCSIVFFKFMPEKMFLAGRYPEGSIGDPLLKYSVLYDEIGYNYIVRYGYNSNEYIITDNIDNVFDITASTRTNNTFDVKELSNMKFVKTDQSGTQTEISKDIIKLFFDCKELGVVDKSNNFIPLYKNELDMKTQQDIIQALSETPNTQTATTKTSDPDPSTSSASTTTTPAA